MLRKTRKTVASFLALSMVFSMATTGLAANAETTKTIAALTDSTVKVTFSDISNHWASKEIGNWSQKGIINGYEDGTFKPNVPISRSEFVSLVNRVLAYPTEGTQSFPDVSSNAWYAKDISRAVAAGIVFGDDKGNFKPEAPISRQEAAVILSRAFDLKAQDKKASDRFTDASKIASWSKDNVNALLEGGYVSGREDGSFDPLANITRAEFVKMIDSVVGELKHTASTYTGNVNSNLVINTKDVNLKNMTISGDLFITPGVGDGNISMDNVTVKGRTVVRGGGEHSIVINNSSLAGTLLVIKNDGKVRIVMQGSSDIPHVQLNSGAKLETENKTGKGFGDVQVIGTISANQEIKLDGNFADVSVEVPGVTVQVIDGSVGKIDVKENAVGSNVKVLNGNVSQLNVQSKATIDLSGGTVGNVDIQKSAEGTSVQMASDSAVTNFKIDAPIEVKGTGKIETATINVDGVKIETNPAKVAVADGVKSNVTAAPTPTGGSSRRSSSNPTAISKTAEEVAGTITAIAAPAKDVIALTLPTVPEGFAVAIKASSDTSIIALDGTVSPQAADATVNLVLEVTRVSDSTKASTASIAVVVPAKSVVQQTAEEVAKAITTIAALAKDAAALKLPNVPPGFTVAIKTSSDTSVIALDGTVAPQAADTTVNLILEVTRASDSTKANTASIAVVVPAKSIVQQTAAEVAGAITTIAAPAKDAAVLTLPTVPAGFTVAIKTSSNTGVIALNGTIVPPTAATTVNLVLEVTRTSDSSKASTASIAVVVSAKSVVQQTAAEVAGAITTIAAPAKDVVALTLPTVPAGFTVAIKTSSNTGVIALNGTIVPPTAATTVNLVLEVTRTSDSSKASTASIAVVVPAKSVVQQTAAEVAGAITTIVAPAKDATALTLPVVPPGFTIAIKTSSDPGVIALNGTIVPPTAATTVNLVLEVTRTSDSSKASTASIAVIVPAKSSVVAGDTDIQLKELGYNYVSDISGDVINITSGNTYIYTVDTAEGAGLTTMTVKSVEELLNQITSKTSNPQTYVVKGAGGAKKMSDPVAQGDILTVSAGQASRDYTVNVIQGALRGQMQLINSVITANTQSDVVLNFFAGMRSPAVEVALKVPKGINATMDNTTVNVIGRGKVKLSGLATQSIGRVGAGYRFQQVGTVSIDNNADGSQLITFKGLDLRPANGADLQITFEGVKVAAGSYGFEASYKTAEPEVLTSPWGGVNLSAVNTISNFNRILDKSLTYKESSDTYTKAKFNWGAAKNAASIKLMQSTDKGVTWTESNAAVSAQSEVVEVANLTPNTEYYFKLAIAGGENNGDSNLAKFYTGKFNAKLMGAKGDGKADETQAINDAIIYLNSLGGGTLLFEGGTFNVRTVHLQSNVYLYVNKDATISALKGGDAPETTYFSDKGYRSGTSATSTGPYKDPENYLTKQDVGHHYFRNSMFFGERLDNIKIIGNGKITGNGNLQTSDGVMDNNPDSRTDKMVTVKLCTNFEFGGLDNGLDLWYEETNSPTTDEPYYIKSINPDGTNEVKQTDISNMLRVDRAGHFAMLATGTDYINTHDFYYDKGSGGGARDVFDYMQSSYVTAKNIYAKGTSDDIVKPGSDSSLGFTRPATDFYVRNIIGDTNCNLFQIGSETVDDIKNAYVDNIYVLAGNKAGFSISTNDGGHIENIYLNYGQTGPIHHKAQMKRTRAPFFISISNRGRVIGGQATRMKFTENGLVRDELLSTNVNIGLVRNVFIKDVNIEEVYQGSQYGDPSKRWKAYGGNPTTKATPIIAGYKVGEGGPTLPDGRNIGYIENLHFENVDVLVKGGNSFADSEISPPELGVGKYNIGDIGEQPSYGFWARHVDGLTFTNVNTKFEVNDDRYAIVLDDVKNATIDNMKMVSGTGNPNVIQLKNASNITLKNSSYFKNTWGNELTSLADLSNVTVTSKQTYPNIKVQDPHNTLIQLKVAGHPNLTNLDKATNAITATLGTTVADIITQLESTDETVQTYSVTDSSNAVKNSGMLETGDILVVTAQDGITKKNYSIVVPLEILVEGESQLTSVIKSIPSITTSSSSTNGIYYLQTNAVPIGEWIEFSIPVPSAGTYNVSYQYKTSATGRATVQAYVNGESRGIPVNFNNTTANLFIPVDLGQVTLPAAGSYPVRFVATSAGSIVIDYIKFTKVTVTAPSTNTNIQLATSHPNVTAVDTTNHTITTVSGTTVAQILAQVSSTDSSTQAYTVMDSGNAAKSSGVLVSGDKLVVTASDATTKATYIITVAASTNTNIQLSSSHPNVTAVDNAAKTVNVTSNSTVADVKSQIVSSDGSTQAYSVTDAGNAAKNSGALVTGDKLVITAADGAAQVTYTIHVALAVSNNTNVVLNATHPNLKAVNAVSIVIAANTTVADLLAQITSADGSIQNYVVTNSGNTPKLSTDVLAAGDILKVTAADGVASKEYSIALPTTNLQLNAGNTTVIAVNNTDRRIATSGVATAVTTIAGQLKSTDGTTQTYTVTNAAGGAPKTNAVNGDKLVVTAADGTTTATYIIAINASPAGTYAQVKAAGHPHVTTVYNSDRTIIAKTGITAANLLAEIESSDALTQAYSVTDAVYASKTGNTLLHTGDLLKVTSQDATANVYYTVYVVDVLFDIDPAGTYTTSNSNTKSTGADDTAGNHDRNSAVNNTHLQVSFPSPPANQYIEFTINVPANGTYDVIFGSKKSNSGRAAMQLTVDGANVGSVNEIVGTTALQGMYLTNVGSVNLTSGNHTFRFTIGGPASGQSFDFIGLTKTN
ncbi:MULTISPECIES: S-layer homology domain-containing protein [unclassified Paenibacillus]|uniref:S-layer homology domain-containing protein n=1 Tax=unclassified Paenibacillus TaxID=185978 RepID=UPI003626707A